MSKNLTLVSSDINQLPNNIEAEQAVIGSVLISNEIFDDIIQILLKIFKSFSKKIAKNKGGGSGMQ